MSLSRSAATGVSSPTGRYSASGSLNPRAAASPAMSELCVKYGISDPATAYHMIENVKRRFRSILRTRLSSLAGSEDEIEAEIRQFIDIFSGGPAGVDMRRFAAYMSAEKPDCRSERPGSGVVQRAGAWQRTPTVWI